MAEQTIPRPDADFAAWTDQFWSVLSNWWAEQGFDPSDLKDLELAVAAWQEAYAAHIAAHNAAMAARSVKAEARTTLERTLRPIAQHLQTLPQMTNATRAELGITIRDTTPSRTPTPTTRPTASVALGERLTHTLRLADESTPTRRRKPKGVARAEVFVALTPPGSPAPANPSDYRYIGSVTRGETTLSFESDKGGMQAHYLSRWVSTSGAAGPWSDTTSATVAA
jgi:hypothetical protein